MPKYSVTINGHATSLSLEPEFWAALQALATARGQSLAALIAEIDAARLAASDKKRNLCAALRVFVLADLQAKLRPTT